jgi:hypothetical protein
MAHLFAKSKHSDKRRSYFMLRHLQNNIDCAQIIVSGRPDQYCIFWFQRWYK